MKKFLLAVILLTQCSFCITLDDLTSPKPFSPRLGTGDKPEGISRVEKTKEKENYKENSKEENRTSSALEVKAINGKDAGLKEIKAEMERENRQIEAKEENRTEFFEEDYSASNGEYEDELQKETNYGASYADLSLKKLAQDISYELDLDEAKTTADLSVLWAATTERSETMKYTVYKLSNPDEDKPNESTLKKIIRPIANFSSIAGASVTGDPFMATGALIGGGLVNAFMKDDKEYNYRFSKVSDADMVLLVRKIDDLQKKLLDLYSDYKTKEQLAKMTEENFKKREEIYINSQEKSKEELVIADVYYRNAKSAAQRAKDDFLTSRAILENLVGLDALEKIERD